MGRDCRLGSGPAARDVGNERSEGGGEWKQDDESGKVKSVMHDGGCLDISAWADDGSVLQRGAGRRV